MIANRINNFIGELFTGDINNFVNRVLLINVIGDCMHKMGFSDTHRPIEKEWIIGMTKVCRNSLSRNETKLVTCRNCEILKCKIRSDSRKMTEGQRFLFWFICGKERCIAFYFLLLDNFGNE